MARDNKVAPSYTAEYLQNLKFVILTNFIGILEINCGSTVQLCFEKCYQ